MVKILPRLWDSLDSLGRFTDAVKPPRSKLRAGRHALAYLMGDTSGLGFGFFIWGQGILSSELGDFYPLYHVIPSNFREGDNLNMRIEHSVSSVEFQDVELFIFTDNVVFGSIYYKGTSKIPLLFDIFLQLHQVQMRGHLILHLVHAAGTRMI